MRGSTNDRQPFRWQPNRVGLLLSCLFLPLLLWLGSWQLDRAELKQRILSQYQTNQAAPRVELGQLPDSVNLQYRRVWVEGSYQLAPTFVVDNKVRHGRPGYEILQIFVPSDGGAALLVNRGWVAAAADRGTLPQLDTPTGLVRLEGELYQRLAGGLQLDDRVAPPLAAQQRVGWLDVGRVEQWLQQPLYRYQLRLDRAAPGALQTGWPVVAIYPHKHTGYAVQWFIMAAVLLLLTVLANSNLLAWLRGRRQRGPIDND